MQQHNVYFYQKSLQYHYRPAYLLLLQSVFCQQVISILRILLGNYFKDFLHKIEDVHPSCAPDLILDFVHSECICQCTWSHSRFCHLGGGKRCIPCLCTWLWTSTKFLIEVVMSSSFESSLCSVFIMNRPICLPQQEFRPVQITFEFFFSNIIFISPKSMLYMWIEILLDINKLCYI
jgi:hypothetical protein